MAFNNSYSNTELFLQNEGILDKNENFETVYLGEDEIEKFMEKYLKENPGTEIETRYINHSPVEVTQDIEVRWLRPETPEIPPIIIKEVNVVDMNEPPPTIRIVQRAAKPFVDEEKKEPVIIREKPKLLPAIEPKIIFVKNEMQQKPVKETIKPITNGNSNNNREIKIEHVRSNSRLMKHETNNNNNNNMNNKISTRLEFDDQVKTDKKLLREIPHYSFEEHASIVDYEEEFEHRRSTVEESADEHFNNNNNNSRYHNRNSQINNNTNNNSNKNVFGPQRTLEEERQLKLYEEKLMQTLYEEYLLRLEREKIERKLQAEGVFDERIREKSMSQERLSQMRSSQHRLSASQSRMSSFHQQQQQQQLNNQDRMREEELKEQLFRERLLREQQLRDEEHRMQKIREQQLREEEIRQQRLKELRLKEQDQLFRSNSSNVNGGGGGGGGGGGSGCKSIVMMNSSIDRSPSETSTYKSIKFNKVTDENELRRYNQILSDPKALSIKNKAEADRIMSSFDVDVSNTLNDSITQQSITPPLPITINNNNNNTNNNTNNNNANNNNNNNTNIITTIHQPLSLPIMNKSMNQSIVQKIPTNNYIQSNDYHTIRQSANDMNSKLSKYDRKEYQTHSSSNLSRPFNDSLSSNSLLNKSKDNISRSGSGIRRHRVTSITSYYNYYPNPTTEKSVYVSRY